MIAIVENKLKQQNYRHLRNHLWAFNVIFVLINITLSNYSRMSHSHMSLNDKKLHLNMSVILNFSSNFFFLRYLAIFLQITQLCMYKSNSTNISIKTKCLLCYVAFLMSLVI